MKSKNTDWSCGVNETTITAPGALLSASGRLLTAVIDQFWTADHKQHFCIIDMSWFFGTQ